MKDGHRDQSRPKRRCNRDTATREGENMPSSVHYLGYVEDEETPDMIMRKFKELEKVQAASNHRIDSQAGMQDILTKFGK